MRRDKLIVFIFITVLVITAANAVGVLISRQASPITTYRIVQPILDIIEVSYPNATIVVVGDLYNCTSNGCSWIGDRVVGHEVVRVYGVGVIEVNIYPDTLRYMLSASNIVLQFFSFVAGAVILRRTGSLLAALIMVFAGMALSYLLAQYY